jgi:DNA-binding response OmpR family regulator
MLDVLLVEDDLDNAHLFKRILETANYRVFHTVRGFDGLQTARKQKFAAIILDFDLPDIDGAQVGLALRRNIGTTPLIALTAHADAVTRRKARHFGFDAFIAKPCTDEDLIGTLQALIQKATPVS